MLLERAERLFCRETSPKDKKVPGRGGKTVAGNFFVIGNRLYRQFI